MEILTCLKLEYSTEIGIPIKRIPCKGSKVMVLTSLQEKGNQRKEKGCFCIMAMVQKHVNYPLLENNIIHPAAIHI